MRELAAAESPEQTVVRLRRNHALLERVRLTQAAIRLERDRRDQPDIWSEELPLISVRIPTYNRTKLLMERAIRSVLAQTYPHFEIVVVGDHTEPQTAEALAAVGDPRIRFYNIPERPVYPSFPRFYWFSGGIPAMNAALDRCQGDWIAPLDDDDEFTPDHLEVLLNEARDRKLELVYGKMACENLDGTWKELGSAPLGPGRLSHSAMFYSKRLLTLRYDFYCWVKEEVSDANLIHQILAIGAQTGFVDRIVGRHFAEYSMIQGDEQRRIFRHPATAETILADLSRTHGEHLLAMA
ncbi:MAG: glycosyltransferase [Cyanobacteria bacterium REEB65]|nr:glycosyltransferase [Cyanobacteria bacterium REEB65]